RLGWVRNRRCADYTRFTASRCVPSAPLIIHAAQRNAVIGGRFTDLAVIRHHSTFFSLAYFVCVVVQSEPPLKLWSIGLLCRLTLQLLLLQLLEQLGHYIAYFLLLPSLTTFLALPVTSCVPLDCHQALLRIWLFSSISSAPGCNAELKKKL